ncbi:tRNA pseudouridine(55) synthase TruB [Arcanobacterium haemolyticum]|nr:tRNA pseudouridine(55) synthase TruB [Arcanobacterium haemolyticum]
MPWGELPRPEEPGEWDGLVVIDKNKGVTSHDIVGAMRRLAGTRKVGHAGTLDPMATGVLCVGVGRATKLLQYITGTTKTYTATIRLGVETSTEDAEGAVTAARGAATLPRDTTELATTLEEAMSQLRGDILQVPSSVSAIKIDGKRSYELVREGTKVELEARPVRIDSFCIRSGPRFVDVDRELVCREGDESCTSLTVCDLDVLVTCSAGTYIRALARDLGNRLGTGAHLTALRRTAVGAWGELEATTIGELADTVRHGGVVPHLSMSEVCASVMPSVEITSEEAGALQHGQFIAMRPWSGEGDVAAAFCSGTVVALVSRRGKKLKPDLILARM